MKVLGVQRPQESTALAKYVYYVYMMGSRSRRALYTGVTSNLSKRVFEHKNDLIDGFTKKY